MIPKLRCAENPIHRRPQLMRHRRQKDRLGFRCSRCLVASLSQLADEISLAFDQSMQLFILELSDQNLDQQRDRQDGNEGQH